MLSLLLITTISGPQIGDIELNSHTETIVVYSRKTDLIGEAISVSQGLISQGEIDQRPILRAGEILEFVPGMVVTQHSGSGKANQYFLRGFNLDHGTDFRTTIDNMPVNMRTHGHGQGYTDLSFITPEFIDGIEYQKGPYHAEDGDFSTAGSARFITANTLSQPLLQLEVGADDYFRSVLAHTFSLDDGQLLIGWEHHAYAGPWTDVDEDVSKNNLLLKYSHADEDSRFAITFMGYDNAWNSADQIPDRAVRQGVVDRLGSLDTDPGGEASRYSVSVVAEDDLWSLDGYVIQSALDLFSNFTYFLDDPVNGDEFKQVDERTIYGGQLVRKLVSGASDNHVHHKVGVQVRYDDIETVGLFKTANREVLSTVREDSVEAYSIGLFWEGEMDLTDNLSANVGARYDYLDVEVNSDISVNSGSDSDGLLSIKGGLQYQFDDQWAGYFDMGQSFHSNDARGATISVDPASNEAIEPVDLLVRGTGAELGVRFYDAGNMNMSLGLWALELDSELLFVGDAGNTEPGRASRRTGAELSLYYWPNDRFSADLELAWTSARFTDEVEGEGDRIDGSLPFVASLGLTWTPVENWRTSLRVRHFGRRTLDSFNDQRSDTFTVVNSAITYQMDNWQTELQILNLFDSEDHDIGYFYASRLPGESEQGAEDLHFHPIEPRTVRLQVRYRF